MASERVVNASRTLRGVAIEEITSCTGRVAVRREGGLVKGGVALKGRRYDEVAGEAVTAV
jgi:hypothetical protein